MCPICFHWARTESDNWQSEHHQHCPLEHENVLELVSRLVSGITRWAADEDGVPEELGPTYDEAKRLLEDTGYERRCAPTDVG